MAKQLNVASLAFTADTSQVKRQIQDLQTQLNNLATSAFSNSNSLGLTKEIKEATGLVAQLKSQLQSATTSSGVLDLGKFNESLKKSQTSITDYKNALVKLGPEGSQAFSKLASSITSAEIPLKRSNALVKEFAVSLANTARWQLSSSVLHGFMSTMQSAYSYAQNLDKSLTDIQIVTSYSADYMADFANKANEAAQALSTTTKQYSDASLIFFQQGLEEEDVLKRTETTIKMAQATGDSVDQVSSYLTAIWNNFYTGSESLEYYADVITKLGAATASSSSEIAEGIQKFAGIGQTIGLSYEYATAALTTLTANTRQSAGEIGNSLKTIFSRFQGVTLGDTLEDGVNLNKYSKALKTIGVDILDVNGEMKDMDTILDETAGRWDELTRAQKMAFAETAAGTMQYTKLVSLMDNWDDMKENLEFAENAEGTLEEQAEIYANSWEGARKRVKAAAEEIYNDLIDPDFFKTFDDLLAKLLNRVDDLIDGFGGLPGVLSIVGAALTRVFSDQIVQNINNIAYSLKMKTQTGRQEVLDRRTEANEALKDKMVTNTDTGEGQAQASAYENQAKVQQTMIDNAQRLNSEEQKHAQLLVEISKAQGEAAIAAGKAYDVEKKKTEAVEQSFLATVKTKSNKNITTADVKSISAQSQKIKELVTSMEQLKSLSSQIGSKKGGGILGSSDSDEKKVEQLKAAIKSYEDILSNSTLKESSFGKQLVDNIEALNTQLEKGNIQGKDFDAALDMIHSTLDECTIGGESFESEMNDLIAKLTSLDMTSENAKTAVYQLVQQFLAEGQAAANAGETTRAAGEGADFAAEQIKKLGDHTATGAEVFTSMASSLMSLSAILNSTKSFAEIITSEDATLIEQLTAAISALMSITMAYNSVQAVMEKLEVSSIALKLADAEATGVLAIAQKVLNEVMGLNPFIRVLMVVIALTTALGGLTKIINLVVKAFKNMDTPEKRMKDAKQAVEDTTSALEEAEAAAENLQSAFDNYDSVYQTLQDCTKGTQEWYDALLDVNQAVIDILSNSPELYSMVNDKGESAIQTDENGTLTIADWAKEELVQKANQEVINNQAAVNQTNQQLRTLETSQSKTDLTNDVISTLNDNASAAVTNAFKLGLVDITDLVGKNINEATQYIKDSINQHDDNSDYKLWNGDSDNLENFARSAVELLDSEGLLNDIQDLKNTIDENNQITNGENQAIASMMMANNKELADSKYGEIMSKSGGAVYDQIYQDAYSSALSKITERGSFNTGTEISKEAMAQYAKLSGLDKDENYKVTNYKGNGDVEIKYTGEDGEVETKTVEAEVIASLVAASEATNNFTSSLDSLIEVIDQLKSDTNKDGSKKTEDEQKTDNALADFFINQNLDEAKKSEIDALQEAIDNAEIVNEEGKVVASGMEAFIDQTLGDGKDGKISEETAKKYGYESGEDLMEALSKALGDSQDAFGDVGKNWMKTVQDSMKDFDTDSMSFNTQKILGDTLNEVFKSSGSEGLNAVKSIMKDLPEDDIENFANVIDNISFDDTSPKQLASALESVGVETDFTTEQLQSLINAMSNAGNAADNLSSKYAKNIEVIDKLSDGDTISADDFDQLDAAYQDYFIQMLDGTYKLVGGAEALQKAVEEDYIKAFESQNNALRQQNKGYQDTLDWSNENGGVDQLKTAGGKDGTNNTILQQQLDLLSTINDETIANQGQIEEWNTALQENGSLSKNQLKEVQEALDAAEISEQSFTNAIAENEAQIHSTNLAILNSCTSLKELQDKAQSFSANGDLISWEEYGQVLSSIASQFDNTADELEKLKQAQREYNEEIEKAKTLTTEEAAQIQETQNAKMAVAMAQVEMATMAGEAAEQYGIDAEVFEAFIDEVAQMDEYTNATTNDVAKLGIAFARANEGLNDLCDNADDYKEILEEITDSGYAQAIIKDTSKTKAFKSSLANLLNTSEDVAEALLSDKKNSELLANALKGSTTAIKALDKEARKLSVIEMGIDIDGGEEALDHLMDQLEEIPEGEEVFIELQGDDQATSAMQSLIQELWNSSDSIDDFQNHLAELDLFGDLAAVAADNLGGIVDGVNLSAAEMEAAGYVLIDNANNMTNGVMEALQLETDIGSDTENVQAEGEAESPPPFSPEENGEYSITLPGASLNTGGDGKRFEFEASTGPTLTYKGVGWTAEKAETSTIENQTPVTSVWVRPRKGGGAGTATHSNRNVNGGGRRSSGSRGGSRRTTRRNSGQKKSTTTGSDRYHTLDKQLNTLDKQYDKISKAKDRAYGSSKVKLMDQEIKKQEQIIQKQKEYLKAAKDNLKIDKQRLLNGKTTYTDSNGKEKTVASGAKNYLGMDVAFDDDGNILNYEALMAAAVDKYNKAVEVFNSKNTDDEAAQLAMDAAEQQYEGFIAWLEQYEETQEIVADKAQEIIDEQNELYDKQFEKTQYILEIELEVNDKELEYLEYLLKKIEDAGDGAAEKITLLGDMAKNSFDRSDSITTSLNDMFYNGNHPELENYKGDLAADMAAGKQEAIDLLSKEEFTDEEMSFIKDQMSSLLSINEALKEAWSQVFDTMDEAFDNGVEKMDEVIAKHEHLMTMTNSWQDTIDILGKDFLGITSETLKKYNDAKITQSKNAYFNAKTKEDTIKANIDTAQSGRDEAAKKRDEAIARGDSEAAAAWDADVKRYEESLKKYNEEFMAAQEDTASLFNESLQTMRDAFDSNLEAILDDFDTQVAGAAGSLDALLEKMDQMEMVSERYVPDYERVYQLTKLTRDLNKSIDETSNIKAKRQLMELQEEIVALQESGVEQSEYDLEYLQKRYEMKVAEIALEEAQNAKSQVRMTKDAEGNFSYVYTADEDSMAEAEQNYEDKLYEMQKLNEEYIQQLEQNMADLSVEFTQKMAELSDTFTYGSEEYNKAALALEETYKEQMQYYSSQMEGVLTNNTILYEQDVKKHAELTGNKAMLDEEYVGSFAETTLAIAGGWTDQEEFMDNWEKAAEDTYAAASAANEEFKDNVTGFMEEAGVSVEEFNEKLAEYSEEAKQDSEDLREEMKKTAEEVQKDFNDVVGGVKAFEEQYTGSINNIISQNELLYKSFMQVIEAHAQFTKNTSTSGAGADDDTGGNEGNNGNGDGDGRRTNTNNADKAEGVAAAIWIWGGRKSGWGDDPERAKKLKEKGVTGAQSVLNSKANSGYLYNKYWSKRNELLTKYAYGKFDTGGYTGDWDGDGKFAMLHQKEIVLNADDTENFLKAIDVVRQISDVIDLNAMSASGGLGSLFASSVNKDNAQLEQNVHITAEFPNATNQNEILAAFDNVINLASQYANQKR